MDNSPLAKLSAELRNIISTMALQHERVIVSVWNFLPTLPVQSFHEGDDRTKSPYALAQTCKQLHNECTSAYYANNSFEIIVLNGNLSDVQFRTWFRNFTRNGELEFQRCIAQQVMDDLDDDEMLLSLNNAIDSISDRENNGLEQLDMLSRSCIFLGERVTMPFCCDWLLLPLVFSAGLFLMKLISQTSYTGAIPDQHGSKCSVRAARVLLWVWGHIEKLNTDEERLAQDEGREPLVLSGFAANNVVSLQGRLKDYITEQLEAEDVPCTHKGCQPGEYI